ncbi:E3 ubiquitin-protein ligase BAH1 [Andrographis paniculata]|uniref:E3 ubiquitin-protein ligase BAH1 n=1 Tax=Andrographis paniculata TaxID=175694 RepID=UPI0021E8D32C|nr:E3 ubiquitin-protein ligase BAH1 [Andrographis paniculata]XP_051141962.1 E3 ubiquitin-protein ligase BAH1 [Andrographis paniculata]XP_051141963.1 E3 ubiquitin-protein ligase BAH1 [Andrographis paniculata]
MKFCKKYEEYMQGVQGKNKLPGVGFKKLKKILKRCRRQIDYGRNDVGDQTNESETHDSSNCPQHCPVCDGTFFPALLEEMSAVVGFFNESAQKLLELHLSSGFGKCLMWFKEKLQGNHVALIQDGRNLVTYAIINAVAMRKILKKYDKIHYSKQGQAFKSQAQSMHIEILQSPWLCELMAFHINLRESKVNSRDTPALFEGCSLAFADGKPSLSCRLLDSVKLDIDLTCAICLETLFDPVSLTCGHMFCYICACRAASVTIVDGLRAASPKKKCPICREEGVYEAAAHLEELHVLLNRSCPEYWEERRKSEKRERVQQAKEHWESQCRLFMGI